MNPEPSVSALPRERPALLRERSAKAKVAVVLVLVAAGWLIFVGIPGWSKHRTFREVDVAVPPFAVQSSAGQRLHSEDWKGRVVVLTFWGTWCPPCRAELPEVARIRERYRDNPGVVFLAVDPGWDGDTVASSNAYLARHHLDLPGAFDLPAAWADRDGQAVRALGVYELPTMFVLDRSGHVRVIYLGYDDSQGLERTLPGQIDALL